MKYYVPEDNNNTYVLHLPKATKGLLDGSKVPSVEYVDVKFVSHEAGRSQGSRKIHDTHDALTRTGS